MQPSIHRCWSTVGFQRAHPPGPALSLQNPTTCPSCYRYRLAAAYGAQAAVELDVWSEMLNNRSSHDTQSN